MGCRRTPAGCGGSERHHEGTARGQAAKLYADCLERRYGRRPVIYYTSGYETWIWDDVMYPERKIQGFHTRDQLQLLVDRRSTRKPLAEQPIDETIVERAYQHGAIRAVTEAYETQLQRKGPGGDGDWHHDEPHQQDHGAADSCGSASEITT